MRCYEIIKELEKIAPERYALSWDNVGLLAGSKDQEVKKVYIALDATDEDIKKAVEGNADMLITHHPLIFSPLKKVNTENFISKRIVKLIQNNISYYAMHTNFDVSVMGELAANYLELSEIDTLDVTWKEENSHNTEGIGKTGILKNEMTLLTLVDLVKEKFRLDHVKVFGDLNSIVSRVAISPGSGKSMIEPAVKKGAQVLITGDIGHHEGIDSIAQNLCIIDAGHYGIESIFIPYIKEQLKGLNANIEIEIADIENPFKII